MSVVNTCLNGGYTLHHRIHLEKLSCMNGNVVIAEDFNTDWLNTNGSERKRFYNKLVLQSTLTYIMIVVMQ